MNASEMPVREMYLRVTDKRGKARIQVHHVWDAELFLQNITQQCVKEGGTVEVSSRAEYMEQVTRERNPTQ